MRAQPSKSKPAILAEGDGEPKARTSSEPPCTDHPGGTVTPRSIPDPCGSVIDSTFFFEAGCGGSSSSVLPRSMGECARFIPVLEEAMARHGSWRGVKASAASRGKAAVLSEIGLHTRDFDVR